jgi:DNA-binding NarL/FixJ family response regulator
MRGPRSTYYFKDMTSFTPREKLVLEALTTSTETSKEISHRLHLGVDTIKRHTFSIYEKTGLCNRFELIHWAIAHKLVPGPCRALESSETK